MMNLKLLHIGAVLALLCLFAHTGHSIEKQTVENLPQWLPAQNRPSEITQPGGTLTWTLAPRHGGDKLPPGDTPQVKGALLPVFRNQPVQIEVRSAEGFPVILVTDRELHRIELQQLLAQGEEGASFPGHPVAFAIGKEREAKLEFTPVRDGVWRVWTWVLPGPLKPQEQLSEEDLKAMEESGVDIASMQAMSQQPDIIRAWLAFDIEK